MAQVHVIAEARAGGLAARVDDHDHLGFGVVPGRLLQHADRRAGADRGHRRRLGEDLGVRPDADFEILRPQALFLQQLLQLHRLRRTWLDLLDRAAERLFDVGTSLHRALRGTARLLLDHALEQRDRKGDAGRLDGLKVDRREQKRLGWVAAVFRVREQRGEIGEAVRVRPRDRRGRIGRLAQIAHRRP